MCEREREREREREKGRGEREREGGRKRERDGESCLGSEVTITHPSKSPEFGVFPPQCPPGQRTRESPLRGRTEVVNGEMLKSVWLPLICSSLSILHRSRWPVHHHTLIIHTIIN